jgi:hypothetical protein
VRFFRASMTDQHITAERGESTRGKKRSVSQRYVHPSPEAVELAFERLTAMNLRRIPSESAGVQQTGAAALQ